ncbi:hypothetical protein F52700_3331 [Fusarium sp. NRRL 52700]|nr:hypothetical protein F52700_3331 [Fusarium sp. NRRL 52700]
MTSIVALLIGTRPQIARRNITVPTPINFHHLDRDARQELGMDEGFTGLQEERIAGRRSGQDPEGKPGLGTLRAAPVEEGKS